MSYDYPSLGIHRNKKEHTAITVRAGSSNTANIEVVIEQDPKIVNSS